MKRYELDIRPLCEHSSYSPYGYYSKGHHNIGVFTKILTETEAVEIEDCDNVVHKWMRIVPYKMEDGEMLRTMVNADANSRGAFPVTYCEL